jgi:hypothetical protein
MLILFHVKNMHKILVGYSSSALPLFELSSSSAMMIPVSGQETTATKSDTSTSATAAAAFLDEWPPSIIQWDATRRVVRLENVCLEISQQQQQQQAAAHPMITLWVNSARRMLDQGEDYNVTIKNAEEEEEEETETALQELLLAKMHPDLSGILKSRDSDSGGLRFMDLTTERDRIILQGSSSGSFSVEWIHAEHLLVQRSRVNNLFHWMQEGFFIHAALFPTTRALSSSSSNNINGNNTNSSKSANYVSQPQPRRRVFHIPTHRTFDSLADLSYAEFMQLVGVDEQRTIHGPVTNVSLRHLDEWSSSSSSWGDNDNDDKNDSKNDNGNDTSKSTSTPSHHPSKWTCFSRALLGLVSPKSLYLGSRILDGPDRELYEHYLNTITKNLEDQHDDGDHDIPNLNTARSTTPALCLVGDAAAAAHPQVTFLLRHSASQNNNSTSSRNATTCKKSRRLENWPEIQRELQRNNVSYQAIDLGTSRELHSFRRQVQLARCSGRNDSILVAAHGQALWLTHFVPSTTRILEILPL